MTILLIDDDPDESAIAQRAIERSDERIQVVTASGFQDGMAYLTGDGQRLRRGELKAVFVDERLRGHRAADVIVAVRALTQWSHLPVVVIAGSSDPTAIQSSVQAGANSFLVKPMDHSEFRDTMVAASHYWCCINETAS